MTVTVVTRPVTVLVVEEERVAVRLAPDRAVAMFWVFPPAAKLLG